jgi:hypothetical protein
VAFVIELLQAWHLLCGECYIVRCCVRRRVTVVWDAYLWVLWGWVERCDMMMRIAVSACQSLKYNQMGSNA